MKQGDWVSIQSPTETNLNQTLQSVVAEIVRITEKAIQIKWKDSSSGNERIYRAWLPKSIITLMETEENEDEDGTFDLHYIALPEWARVDVQ
jgi:type IV secretory pathway TrbF-like protein